MRQVVFTIYGEPAPQGSKRAFVHKSTGRAVVIEDSKRTKPWRNAVTSEAVDHLPDPPFEDDTPLEVRLRFLLPRPKGHFGTGRNAGKVKASSPDFPAVRPDVDKLARSTLDGLTDAGLVPDDSRIVSLALEKRYTEWGPRCDVQVREAVK